MDNFHDASALTAGPPVVYEYLTTIELNTTNVTVIEQLRTILGNISYPFTINSNIQIREVNITTGETQSSGQFLSHVITLCRWLNRIYFNYNVFACFSCLMMCYDCITQSLQNFADIFCDCYDQKCLILRQLLWKIAAQFVMICVFCAKIVGISKNCRNLWDVLMYIISFKS